ncbi:MAG: DUF4494 domain-containing protein [Ruminococcus flavefaciens]|nr:DUF4494 domain-containing protein [Ruminococcus flavefaciens]
MQDNGTLKRVTQSYLVDALSFTEAEARIIEEVKPYISGEFTVSAVAKSKIAEIFWNENADRWYQVKVAFITIDEKTAAEKRNVSVIMVQACDFNNALENFLDGMKGTMADFEIVSIAETNIVDVFKAKLSEE